MEQLLQTTMQFDKEGAPDLLFSHGSRASEYNERGWLSVLDSAIEKADILIDKDDYVSSLLSSVTINDYLYGLPQDVHSTMIMVREDILIKNGLSIPTNYNELVAVCEAAIEKDHAYLSDPVAGADAAEHTCRLCLEERCPEGLRHNLRNDGVSFLDAACRWRGV